MTRKTARIATALTAAAIAIGLGVGLAGCGDDGPVSDLPDGVVAQVGDAEITQAELDRALAQRRAQAQQSNASFPDEGTDAYDALRREALESLVLERVVDFESRRCGKDCRVTSKEVDQELERITEEQFNGSDEELQKFLRQARLTRADARRILRFQLQQPKLFNHVTRGVRFTIADARDYYRENIAQFRVAAGRTASHILVETKAKADALRAEITPENFAELARANSIDTGSKAQGGNLGPIQRGQLVPQFEKVAFALGDGEISDPVKTQFGWHIIIVDVTPARTTPFAEARQQIISQQLDQRRQQEFEAWREDVLAEWQDRSTYASEDLAPVSTETATDADETVPAP